MKHAHFAAVVHLEEVPLVVQSRIRLVQLAANVCYPDPALGPCFSHQRLLEKMSLDTQRI